MRWRQILNVKIIYALSKNLGCVVSFDPEAQSRVQAPQALFQTLINVLVTHSLTSGHHASLGAQLENAPHPKSAIDARTDARTLLHVVE